MHHFSEKSYHHKMRLGEVLAHQEGKEAMKKLELKGWKVEDLERWYVEDKVFKVMAKIRVVGVDTESMSEDDLRKQVEKWDSGPKVERVFNREKGKCEYYVMMLGTKLDQQMTDETGVRTKEEDEEGKRDEPSVPSEHEKERVEQEKMLR